MWYRDRSFKEEAAKSDLEEFEWHEIQDFVYEFFSRAGFSR